jgi:hypothetical protein
MLRGRPKHHAPDASEPVDADLDRHALSEIPVNSTI